MEFCRATKNDIQRLEYIFCMCFSESKENAQVYFKNLLDYKNAYVAKVDGEICASLYLLDTFTVVDKVKYKSHYLFGAGTLAEYRKKGIMKKLIEYALNEAEKNGDVLSALLPANENLYSYYGKCGYEKTYKCKVKTFKYKDIIIDNKKEYVKNKTIFDNMSKLRFNRVSNISGSMHFSKEYLHAVDDILSLYGGGLLSFNSGYVVYYKDKNIVFMQEIMCEKGNLKNILSDFATAIKADEYKVRVPVAFEDELINQIQTIDFGMVKFLGDNKENNKNLKERFNNAYLGLTID